MVIPGPTWPVRTAARLTGSVLTRWLRQPMGYDAFLRRGVGVAWAVPTEAARPLLLPGLALDVHVDDTGREWALVTAVATELEGLRPRGLPFTVGRPRQVMLHYGVLATLAVPRGRPMRGVRPLVVCSDDPMSVLGANLTSRRSNRRADVRLSEPSSRQVELHVSSSGGAADLHLTVDRDDAALPPTSVFADLRTARRFAVPPSRSFDEDPDGVVVVEVLGEGYDPEPVGVQVCASTFFERGPLAGVEARLSSAWYLGARDLRWRAGQLYPAEDG